MAYDKKYRTRVVEYFLEGHTQAETSEAFKVGITSIKRWIASYKNSGSPGGGYTVCNRGAKKINPEKLETYMNEHPDAFLKEIASEFSCCIESARRALLRNRYTYKKRQNIIKNVMKKRELSLSRR